MKKTTGRLNPAHILWRQEESDFITKGVQLKEGICWLSWKRLTRERTGLSDHARTGIES